MEKTINFYNNQMYILGKKEEKTIVNFVLNQQIMLKFLSYCLFFQKLLYYFTPILILFLFIYIVYLGGGGVWFIISVFPFFIFLLFFYSNKIKKKIKKDKIDNFHEYFFNEKYNFINLFVWIIFFIYFPTYFKRIFTFYTDIPTSVMHSYIITQTPFPEYNFFDRIFLSIVNGSFMELIFKLALNLLHFLPFFGLCFFLIFYYFFYKPKVSSFLSIILKIRFLSMGIYPFVLIIIFPTMIISYFISFFTRFEILKYYPKGQLTSFKKIGKNYESGFYLLMKQ